MDTNKMREQFEVWYVKEFHSGVRDQCTERWMSRDEVSGGYLYRDPQQAWNAWKASREAVVVELPSHSDHEIYNDKSDFLHIDGESLMSSVRYAIEAQGLKVAQ